MQEAWAFEHSIRCSVSLEFAWKFWTEVSNWTLDADIQYVTLDGAFRAGAWGVTQTKSSGQVAWRIAEMEPGRAVIEFPAPGATGRFVWTFGDEAVGGVWITQRASLAGEQAAGYVWSHWGLRWSREFPQGCASWAKRWRRQPQWSELSYAASSKKGIAAVSGLSSSAMRTATPMSPL